MQIFNHTYSNGLRLCYQKTESNVCAVNILFNVGSRNESKSEEGYSHFIEHLMFKSSEKFSTTEIMDKLAFYGADYNAYTSRTMTRYNFKCLSENFEKCFEIYADMICHPKYLPEEIDKERNVVIEEMKKCADDPVEVAYSTTMDNFFYENSYAHDELGSEENILSVTREQLLCYKNKHYTADNCIVSVVSCVDFEFVKDVVEKYFSSCFTKEASPKLLDSNEILPNIKTKLEIVERPDNQANVCIKIKGIRATDKNKAVADIFVSVLGGFSSSRLYKTIREELGLVYTIYAFNDANYLTGSITILFGTRPKNLSKALSKIKEVLADMGNNGITEEELAMAKNSRKSLLVFSTETAGDTAEINGTMVNLYGKVKSKEERCKNIDSVTIDAVNAFAKQVASETQITLSAVGKDLNKQKIEF